MSAHFCHLGQERQGAVAGSHPVSLWLYYKCSTSPLRTFPVIPAERYAELTYEFEVRNFGELPRQVRFEPSPPPVMYTGDPGAVLQVC